MSISPAKKLTVFVVIGTAFGLFCVILGVLNQNYVLVGAGILAALGGLALTAMAISRQRQRR
ncbi:hypothetical protein [Streptomyces sp. NPDC008137]|uniref:hypothetical protein n=1 Tax=Streptomyces sp. NPDC008137 TaxID=3364813 RepID=UPI0036EE9677